MPKPCTTSLRRSDGVAIAAIGVVAAFVGTVWLVSPIRAGAAEPRLLPPEEAFRFAARALDSRTLEARFTIADGYYLYRDKLRFEVEPESATLAATVLPPGKLKDDEFFGRVETYRDRVVVRLPLDRAGPGQSLTLRADSQGCADAGVCYPPTTQRIVLSIPASDGKPGPLIEAMPEKKRWFN